MLNAKINNSKSKMERIRESVILRGSDPLGVRSHLNAPSNFWRQFPGTKAQPASETLERKL